MILTIHSLSKSIQLHFYQYSVHAASFYRQLNLWGFERVGKKRSKRSAWQNLYFQRDRPELIKFMKRCSVKDNNSKLIQSQPNTSFREAKPQAVDFIEAKKQPATTSDGRRNESLVNQTMDLQVKSTSKTPRGECSLNAQSSMKLFVAEYAKSVTIISDITPPTRRDIETNTNDAIYRTVSAEEPNAKPAATCSKLRDEIIKEPDNEQSEDDISDGQAEAAYALVAMMNKEYHGW